MAIDEDLRGFAGCLNGITYSIVFIWIPLVLIYLLVF